MKNFHFHYSWLLVCSILMAMMMSSCESTSKETQNPSAYITDSEKLAMLHSMKDLDGTGRLYEINYTADYKLDEVLSAGLTETTKLFGYVAYLLYDIKPSASWNVQYDAGCSCFAVPDSKTSKYLMGRNYDYRHFNADKTSYVPTSAILVHTAPQGGKKSISMVDGLNMGYGKGFYTDGNTDLSLLMGLPYAALDGINEDGFAIGVLALKENQTKQETGQPRIGTTTAIRMLLDRASTVKEALAMLEKYDMDMQGSGHSNYHYFMADATGDYAIVEYTFEKGKKIPTIMEKLTGNDTLRCVTNFYVSPTMVGTNDGWGSDHGKNRYWTIRNKLAENNYELSADGAMSLLSDVSQPADLENITSQTQWSCLYNLSEKSLRLAILREYGKMYNFKVK